MGKKKFSLKFLRKRNEDERGVAAVEFALIVPLLFTFLFGIVTYGYILSFQQSVTQSAAEGARAAAISASATTNTQKATSAKAAIDRSMGAYDAKCGDGALICTTTLAACQGETTRTCATVKVEYNWDARPRIPELPLLPSPDKIGHTAVVEVS